MATDFAVVKINSKQHLIQKDSRLKVDSVSEDSAIEVIMAGISDKISFGEPVLSDFGVKFQVVSEGKDDKVIVRRYKSKSRYRKNKGHRQPISTLKVIEFGKNVKNELVWDTPEAKKAEKPEAKVKAKAKPAKTEAKAEKAVKTAKPRKSAKSKSE
jgi:large subunit ribosomal protein L21